MAGTSVAVVGATGAVGREMVAVLEERAFPVSRLRLLASARSKGSRIAFRGEEIPVEVASSGSFAGTEIALFSPGAAASRELVPAATSAGAVAVDNTSAFRMDPDVPLVVPEVNLHALASRPRGIVANPNCSTIQMVVALAPLHRRFGLRRVVVATYQSVSGAGRRAMDELRRQCSDFLAGQTPRPEVFPHPIGLDCIPQIGAFDDDGHTAEEMKMVLETRKILEEPLLPVTATCVRVPVLRGHSEAVFVEMAERVDLEEARSLLERSPGVVVVDEPSRALYPLALEASGRDPVYVGRLRLDVSSPNGLSMWIVSDNLRKGAALNAVQIAEHVARGD